MATNYYRSLMFSTSFILFLIDIKSLQCLNRLFPGQYSRFLCGQTQADIIIEYYLILLNDSKARKNCETDFDFENDNI